MPCAGCRRPRTREPFGKQSIEYIVAAGNPPTLIIQGTNDQDIPAAWTQATLAALQAKGIESRVTWYPGAMHDFAGANLSSAVREQENWIRHALGMPALGA